MAAPASTTTPLVAIAGDSLFMLQGDTRTPSLPTMNSLPAMDQARSLLCFQWVNPLLPALCKMIGAQLLQSMMKKGERGFIIAQYSADDKLVSGSARWVPLETMSQKAMDADPKFQTYLKNMDPHIQLAYYLDHAKHGTSAGVFALPSLTGGMGATLALMQCAQCKNAAKAHRCSACHRVYYCGVECQAKHWPEHRKECKVTTTA